MNVRFGWLIVLVVAAFLAAACGPETVAPTLPEPSAEGAVVEELPTETSIVEASATVEEEESVEESKPSTELPVDEDDWHILGSPDAPVTIVEYSDFQ